MSVLDTIPALRGVVAAMSFTDSYEVLRQVSVPDGEGGNTYTEAVTSSGTGDLQQIAAGSDQQVIADRLAISRPAVLYVAVDADITPTDRLRVNGTRLFKVMDVGQRGNLAIRRQVVMDEQVVP